MIEQPSGPPLVPPVEASAVEAHRRSTYEAYETWLRKRLFEFDAERPTHWNRDYSNHQAYMASVAPMLTRFKRMLGFWLEPGERPPLQAPQEVPLLETEFCTAARFTYEILPGLRTYAIRLVPKTPGPHPGLLVQHGYMGSPELACGFTPSANAEEVSYRSLGLRAASRGYHVIAPHHPSGFGTLSDSIDVPLPGHEKQTVHYGKNRLHRLCILGGGTLLGLDMLASSRAVDLLAEHTQVDADRIGIYGLSRGGQTALFLAALDPRIKASVCSAYFNHRLSKLIGPCSRTNYVDWFAEGQILPEQVRYFADADIVSLIAPRAFAIEAGLSDSAVDQEVAREEFTRARCHYENLGVTDFIEFIAHQDGHVSATAEAFQFLARHLQP